MKSSINCDSSTSCGFFVSLHVPFWSTDLVISFYIFLLLMDLLALSMCMVAHIYYVLMLVHKSHSANQTTEPEYDNIEERFWKYDKVTK